MEEGTFRGMEYGIFLERSELSQCIKQGNNEFCSLYVGFLLDDLLLGEDEVELLNVSVSTLQCRIEVRRLEWDDSICQVDRFASGPEVTACKCSQAPPKFKLTTDVVVPVTKIDFDSVFVGGCEDCADPVAFYVIITLMIWCGAIKWTVRTDNDEISTLKICDQRKEDEEQPYLLVIDTRMSSTIERIHPKQGTKSDFKNLLSFRWAFLAFLGSAGFRTLTLSTFTCLLSCRSTSRPFFSNVA